MQYACLFFATLGLSDGGPPSLLYFYKCLLDLHNWITNVFFLVNRRQNLGDNYIPCSEVQMVYFTQSRDNGRTNEVKKQFSFRWFPVHIHGECVSYFKHVDSTQKLYCFCLSARLHKKLLTIVLSHRAIYKRRDRLQTWTQEQCRKPSINNICPSFAQRINKLFITTQCWYTALQVYTDLGIYSLCQIQPSLQEALHLCLD